MMKMSDTVIIKTLTDKAETTYKEKGSEFTAIAFPVKNEEEIQQFLTETRKKYYDASHHCYAFRLKDKSFRYSDAGEPSSTAGIRILNAIDHFEATDLLIIVVRYFGGVKLGVGALGRAYYSSAQQVLQKCSCQQEKPCYRVTITVDFNLIGTVHRIIANHSAIIENIIYGEKATFECLIPEEGLNNTLSELSSSGGGQITVLNSNKKIFHSF